MSRFLIQVFLGVILNFSAKTFASVDIPSDDSDLTKSILDGNPTPGAHLFSNADEVEQTSVKSENQHSDIYGQTHAEQLNEQLSVLDVILRKRRTEASTKSEEKVLDIPHVDKLPIKYDVPEYVASNNPPSIQEEKTEKDATDERAHVRPITFKLTSPTNQDDNTANDKQLDDDKAKGESVKIIVSPLARATS